MIKKIVYILILLQFSCSPKECFMAKGNTITKEIDLPLFDEILVGNEISLIIKQGAEQKVLVKTGENLMDEISVKVIDNQLLLSDDNSCNFTRDYAITKVVVTSPNIKRIRSNTARLIKSEGILNYPNLTLISEDNADSSLLNIGDFDLDISSNNTNIISNGSSIFTIKGNTNNLNIGFYCGTSRFNGQELIANNVTITQKSTNDILVNPQDSLKAYIYTIGDVISFNIPPIIVVEEHYTGRLIFN